MKLIILRLYCHVKKIHFKCPPPFLHKRIASMPSVFFFPPRYICIGISRLTLLTFSHSVAWQATDHSIANRRNWASMQTISLQVSFLALRKNLWLENYFPHLKLTYLNGNWNRDLCFCENRLLPYSSEFKKIPSQLDSTRMCYFSGNGSSRII